MSSQYQLHWRLFRDSKYVYLRLKFLQNDHFWNQLDIASDSSQKSDLILRSLASEAEGKSITLHLRLLNKSECHKSKKDFDGLEINRNSNVTNVIKPNEHYSWMQLLRVLAGYFSQDQLTYLGLSSAKEIKPKTHQSRGLSKNIMRSSEARCLSSHHVPRFRKGRVS